MRFIKEVEVEGERLYLHENNGEYVLLRERKNQQWTDTLHTTNFADVEFVYTSNNKLMIDCGRYVYKKQDLRELIQYLSTTGMENVTE